MKFVHQKIDLSNEDHCGPCGQYALEKHLKNERIIQRIIFTYRFERL